MRAAYDDQRFEEHPPTVWDLPEDRRCRSMPPNGRARRKAGHRRVVSAVEDEIQKTS
jgi:hypothetical protein